MYIYTRVYCMCCVCAACALCKPTSVCFFCVCVCELPIVVLFVLGCLLKTLLLWQKNQEHNRSVRTVCVCCVCACCVCSACCVCVCCACAFHVRACAVGCQCCICVNVLVSQVNRIRHTKN